MKKKTLLEKAIGIGGKRSYSRKIDVEEIELAIAYAVGDISLRQFCRVLEITESVGANKASQTLLKAIKSGRVEIKILKFIGE